MSSPDDIAPALAGFRAAIEAGRVAHAWVIVGPPRGAATALAEGLLELQFCTSPAAPCRHCAGCRQVRAHEHADVLWVEPESKSRQITVDRFRDDILPRLSQKSFEGGWKAVVVQYADRMHPATANAFLKTLEEPPPQSMILLLTDAPDRLPPTIVSRCQRLVAAGGGDSAADNPWRERMLDLLAEGPGQGTLGRLASAAALVDLDEEIRKAVEAEVKAESSPAAGERADAGGAKTKTDKDILEARIRARQGEIRHDLLTLAVEWQRDLLTLVLGGTAAGLRHPTREEALRRQAAGLDYAAALVRVRKAEDMVRQFGRNLSSDAVFWAFFRDLPAGVPTR